jgi:hypothetical protein
VRRPLLFDVHAYHLNESFALLLDSDAAAMLRMMRLSTLFVLLMSRTSIPVASTRTKRLLENYGLAPNQARTRVALGLFRRYTKW